MILFLLSAASACCAVVPALLARANLREYRPPADVVQQGPFAVSVIIPARNEEANIAACIESVVGSSCCQLEVLAVDDNSTDRTAELCAAVALQDERVRLLSSPGLPSGWNGKQHACWIGAQSARFDILCFLDADVRLAPEALVRMAALLRREQAGLVSGFPLQVTETPMEWLLLPLIHFVLMGMLPMRAMRCTTRPAFAAGCGQFLMVDRTAYTVSGGHAAIRSTMHDGLRLPYSVRSHGFGTRLADLTGLATCRMYHSAGEVWNGLAKNATEGLAAPARIVPVTVFLLLGQVFPLPLLACAGARFLRTQDRRDLAAATLALAATALSYGTRLVLARRYRQRRAGALLHPVGIAVLLGLQWYALARKLQGKPAQWRQRTYAPEGAGQD